jgi:hypothetical protein
LGLPDLPSGWTYSCVTSANLVNTDSTGWIPVNFQDTNLVGVVQLTSLPIDPTNTTSTGLYYTYVMGNSFKLTSRTESEKYLETAQNDGGIDEVQVEKGTSMSLAPFLANWVYIPGNSTYSTTGFFIMKYEAKYDKDGDGEGDIATGCVASSGSGYDWRDCGSGGTLVSTANGAPIVHITHTQAKTACQSIGAELPTNDEWMTIVRNIDQQEENWTGGSVGSGCLFRGNSGETTCGYNSSLDPDYGKSRNARAYHTLSTNDTLYDISANAFEHTMFDVSDTLISYQVVVSNSSTWKWSEYTALTGYGDFTANQLFASDSSWTSSEGVGQIYHKDYDGASSATVIVRGGDWNYGTYSGVITAATHWPANGQDSYTGLRCVH